MRGHRAVNARVFALIAMVLGLPGAAGAQAQDLPYLRCYVITQGTAPNEPAVLTDQFFSEDAVTVRAPQLLCTLATLDGVGTAPGNALKCYRTTPAGPPANAPVTVSDQFAEDAVTVRTPHYVCVPALVE
jgi:hypothetical protein